jgi:hypothetical protein
MSEHNIIEALEAQLRLSQGNITMTKMDEQWYKESKLRWRGSADIYDELIEVGHKDERFTVLVSGGKNVRIIFEMLCINLVTHMGQVRIDIDRRGERYYEIEGREVQRYGSKFDFEYRGDDWPMDKFDATTLDSVEYEGDTVKYKHITVQLCGPDHMLELNTGLLKLRINYDGAIIFIVDDVEYCCDAAAGTVNKIEPRV